MAQRQKISQMTPKGANLEATDLLEVSVQTGSGYSTYSITGQEIIDAASGGGSTNIYNTDGTLTGNRVMSMDNHYLALDGGNNVCRLILDSDNNKGRLLSFRTDNSQRWAIRVDGNETGSQSGADIAIRRYDDIGNYIDSPLSIERSNGYITVLKPKYTVELIDALTVDFYAPYNLSIDSVTNILNSPTTTLKDDGVTYTLGATIASGSKITVTVNTAAVVTLNATRL